MEGKGGLIIGGGGAEGMSPPLKLLAPHPGPLFLRLWELQKLSTLFVNLAIFELFLALSY